jgi:REP element-mobilizing transposase RayT
MGLTPWHITFGTYGTRLHGDERPTVDRDHNTYGRPFLGANERRERFERDLLVARPVYLTRPLQRFIESVIPSICERGGWKFVACAAGPDHVHVVLAADPERHGKDVRRWLKRWLGEALDLECPARAGEARPGWWAEGGSTKAIHDRAYLGNAIRYVRGQRATEEDRGDTPRLTGDNAEP